jgi:deoxycytidylate deaminase
MSKFSFINAATEAALASTTLANRHGCVIVIGGKIVATGHNSERTTMRGHTCCSVHAEMCALSRLLRGRRQQVEKRKSCAEKGKKETRQDEPRRLVRSAD